MRHRIGFRYFNVKGLVKSVITSRLKDWIKFFCDMRAYRKANTIKDFKLNVKLMYPWLKDWRDFAGTSLNNLYLRQDLWAAKKIFHNHPEKHFDIGSRVDGFITHLLSFGVDVTLIDIRALEGTIDDLSFLQADATNLSNISDNSIASLSALCSLEHFGLGRYGDPIDPAACFKAFQSIQRVLAEDGDLYLSLPVGKDELAFNAHRIFNPETVITAFDKLRLVEYSCVTKTHQHYQIPHVQIDEVMNTLLRTSRNEDMFGLFHFKKPSLIGHTS